MGNHLFGGYLRFAGGNADIPARPAQGAQQAADAGKHPVFIQAHGGVALTVVCHSLPGPVLVHAHVGLKGIHQRRADKLAQGIPLRVGITHAVRRIANAVPDALLGLGQGSVQIKNYSLTQSSESPSTPNRS